MEGPPSSQTVASKLQTLEGSKASRPGVKLLGARAWVRADMKQVSLHLTESHVALGRSHSVSVLNRSVSVLLVGSLMDARLCSMLFLCWLSMLSSFSLMFSYIHFSTRGLGSLEFLGAQARARAGMTRDTQFLNLIEYSGRTKFGYVVGCVHMCALLFPTDTNGPLFYF